MDNDNEDSRGFDILCESNKQRTSQVGSLGYSLWKVEAQLRGFSVSLVDIEGEGFDGFMSNPKTGKANTVQGKTMMGAPGQTGFSILLKKKNKKQLTKTGTYGGEECTESYSVYTEKSFNYLALIVLDREQLRVPKHIIMVPSSSIDFSVSSFTLYPHDNLWPADEGISPFTMKKVYHKSNSLESLFD